MNHKKELLRSLWVAFKVSLQERQNFLHHVPSSSIPALSHAIPTTRGPQLLCPEIFCEIHLKTDCNNNALTSLRRRA